MKSVQFAGNEDATGTPLRKKSLNKEKSVVLTPQKKLMTALLRCFLFFEGFSHNGWNHVNNVYYVVVTGWSPLKVRKAEQGVNNSSDSSVFASPNS